MSKLRIELESRLRQIEHVDIRPYKETDLICVYYKEKEFAHFHDHEEIDIRMLPKFVRAQKLGPPFQSDHHPNRSKNSRWRSFQFKTKQDVDHLVDMISALIDAE